MRKEERKEDMEEGEKERGGCYGIFVHGMMM